MSSRESARPSGFEAAGPVPAWAIGSIVLALLAVLVATGVVLTSVANSRGDVTRGAPVQQPSTGESAEGVGTLPEPPPLEGEPPLPTGRVAYVTGDGRVLVGTGAELEVRELASDAAIGEASLGAVEIAPTGDLLAYVRADGALVVLPISGGAPLVVATDVALDAVGTGPVLAWDPTGVQIAYLAVGTAEMARPRPETPPPLSGDEVYRIPLPEGVLGNVVKVVDRGGGEVVQIGDPSTRSMVGLATSQSDDLIILESVAPDTGRPYTLSIGSSASPDPLPTILSADDPAFSPDGNFVVAVGPDKSGQELVRIATDQLSRTTLVSTDRVCNPAVSPDSTRIVYGSGENCSKLHLISANGGQPVDITPSAGPGDATYGTGALGWTPDGRFITFADCRATAGPVRCGGPVSFLDPDLRQLLAGPEASTVAPIRQPLLQDLQLDLIMDGPLKYQGSFPIDATVEGELTELEGDAGRIDVTVTDDDRVVRLELEVKEGADFATGRLTLTDPESGIDRSFLVLGAPSVIGIRIVSLTGMWFSTDDLPFATGEFKLAVRRR